MYPLCIHFCTAKTFWLNPVHKYMSTCYTGAENIGDGGGDGGEDEGGGDGEGEGEGGSGKWQ